MLVSHDGFSLWFDTPDAPAPPAELGDLQGACLTVGLQPLHLANAVDVRYRVDGGPVLRVAAREIKADYDRGVHYFRARFPDRVRGGLVEYCPVASCAGRQVPEPRAQERMLGAFRVIPAAPRAPERSVVGARRFEPKLEWLGRAEIALKPPLVIGQTPQGLRIDFYVKDGNIRGGRFDARVHENTVDYMLVRPDGIGQIDVHGSLVTCDGAVVSTSYGGVIDFGSDGYAKVLAGVYPELPPIQLAPRFLTADRRYSWLNRAQMFGVGNVDMHGLVVRYDLYAPAGTLPAQGVPRA
jgi:uncharacterized protein DUF3237